jgi:3-hydroxyacyl-CoA dehydrogenase / enoyl-CoA hydratase / 3-hydroxybutyryl-CoA epimerase
MSSVAAAVPGTAARAFVLERRGDLAILWFDLPGEKVNKFSTWVMQEFSGIVDQLAAATDIKKLIVASRKPSIFIAGADVSEFTLATNVEQAKEYTRFGQQTFHRFSKLPWAAAANWLSVATGGS